MVEDYVPVISSPQGIVFLLGLISHSESDESDHHIVRRDYSREVLDADSVSRGSLSGYGDVTVLDVQRKLACVLEAATFGLPIIASDLDYAHEVTTGYKGVEFVHSGDYTLWAKKIINICENRQKYLPMKSKASEWRQIFERILDENNN